MVFVKWHASTKAKMSSSFEQLSFVLSLFQPYCSSEMEDFRDLVIGCGPNRLSPCTSVKLDNGKGRFHSSGNV